MILSMLAHASANLRICARPGRIRQLGRERLGARSDAALCRLLKLDQRSMRELLRGDRQPSSPVIALFVTRLDAPFEELFAIEHITSPVKPNTPVSIAA